MAEKPTVAIVVDSAASLPADAKQYRRLYVVPMLLHFGETTYMDGDQYSPTSFYRTLRRTSKVPTTSAPPPASYLDAFRRASEDARSILCLTVASRFSASFASAETAAKELHAERPAVEIRVLDSDNAAGAEGLIALESWRAASRGGTLDDVVAAAETIMPRVRLLAFVDTLRFLWKSGRVPGIAHAGTSILQIKPLFELFQGGISTVARPRTHRRAMTRLLALMRERVGSGCRLHATVMHADDLDSAQELLKRIETDHVCDELFISEFSPVLGAHTGPGLLGVAFWSRSARDVQS